MTTKQKYQGGYVIVKPWLSDGSYTTNDATDEHRIASAVRACERAAETLGDGNYILLHFLDDGETAKVVANITVERKASVR